MKTSVSHSVNVQYVGCDTVTNAHFYCRASLNRCHNRTDSMFPVRTQSPRAKLRSSADIHASIFAQNYDWECNYLGYFRIFPHNSAANYMLLTRQPSLTTPTLQVDARHSSTPPTTFARAHSAWGQERRKWQTSRTSFQTLPILHLDRLYPCSPSQLRAHLRLRWEHHTTRSRPTL